MSISYEEALSTLTSMFGHPWTEQTLDAVLRHHEGHMENTVESILLHGDAHPKLLLLKLKKTKLIAANQTAFDEQLARQLSNEGVEDRPRLGAMGLYNKITSHITTPVALPAAFPAKKGRDAPSERTPDFLLLSGRKKIAEDNDEALARMLQDELFSEELQNNPEFSHLARDREDILRQGSYPSIGGSNSLFSGYSNRTDEKPGIMEALSELGENAKKRLTLIISRFNKMNNNKSVSTGRLGGSNTVSEVTGLLEDNDVEQISFTRSRETDFEMGSMRSAGVTGDKKRD